MSSVYEGFKYSFFFLNLRCFDGGLAQLARAFDWQSKGQGFDSPNLHKIIVQINAKPCKHDVCGVFYLYTLCKKVHLIEK